jgi:hypothetical protein
MGEPGERTPAEKEGGHGNRSIFRRPRARMRVSGAGYLEQEATAFGLPLPAAAGRFEYLEDTLELAMHMWLGTRRPTMAEESPWSHRNSTPGPSVRRTLACSSAVPENGAPCASWRGTRMPPTSSTCPTSGQRCHTRIPS